MRSLQGKCLGEISDSRREKEKGKSRSNKGSHQRTNFKPFRKSGPGGKYGQRKSGSLRPGILGKRQRKEREETKIEVQVVVRWIPRISIL